MDTPELKPNWAGCFATFDDWVNRATRLLHDYAPPHPCDGRPMPAICVDAKGRRCTMGFDFIRARDEKTFPVFFFWDCETEDAS